MPLRLPRRTDSSAQWTVKLDETRIAVLTAGDRDREVEALRRPRALVGDDAEEEVRGEERPEQHDLRDDEEQDAERLAVDPRALMGLGRTVVLVLARRARNRNRSGLHQAGTSCGRRSLLRSLGSRRAPAS